MSMNVAFDADWYLNDSDKVWLRDSYFPTKFNEGMVNIQFADIILPFDIRASNGYNEPYAFGIDIKLHPTTWVDSLGQGDAGLFTPPGPITTPMSRSKIEIAWDVEMRVGTVLQHEICHWILWIHRNILGDEIWQYFQHGMNTPDPKNRDRYLLKTVNEGRRAYNRGHSSDPFLAGVGF